MYYNYWYDNHLRKKIHKEVQELVETYKHLDTEEIRQKIIDYLKSDEDFKPYKVKCDYDVLSGKITVFVN